MFFTMMAGKVILAILNDLLLCVIGVLGGGHGGVTRTIRMLSHDPEGGVKGILVVASSDKILVLRESSLLGALYAAFRDELLVQLSEAPIGHGEKIIPRWSGDKLPHK